MKLKVAIPSFQHTCMHVVVWISQGQRYAMPSSAIVEVIPYVESRAIPGCEAWLIGLFNYRGELLPLLDWSRLLNEEPAPVRMACRILIVRRDASAEDAQLCGLLVEHVLGTQQVDTDASGSDPPASASHFAYLGPLVLTPAGPVQLTVPSSLPVVK